MIWLINTTTGNIVKNDDGELCKPANMKDAKRILDQVNQLKRLNPKHANDKILIVRAAV